MCVYYSSRNHAYQYAHLCIHVQGYLFDRRQAGRYLREEWGMPPDPHDVVTCVRRFGRPGDHPDKGTGREHITGARMATTNGHEVCIPHVH